MQGYIGTAPTSTYALLALDDLLPGFGQRSGGLQSFFPDMMAGRYLVFCTYGSAATAEGRRAPETIARFRERFDDVRSSSFGVSADVADEADARVKDVLPGIRYLWDFDGTVGRLLGAIARETPTANVTRPSWVVVDPSLHVLRVISFRADGNDSDDLIDFLDSLPHPSRFAGFEVPAPVLVLPNVFDAGLCQRLIDLYDENGGGESGVMRNNVGVYDRSFKSRKGYSFIDPKLIAHVQTLISRLILPEIESSFS